MRGRNSTAYNLVETALLLSTLSLDEINRTVKINKKKIHQICIQVVKLIKNLTKNMEVHLMVFSAIFLVNYLFVTMKNLPCTETI